MKYAHILLTKTDNIKDFEVIDSDLITKVVIDSDDYVDIYDKVRQKYQKIKMINISVYDHILLIDCFKHAILNIMWKPEKV